ncbi:MAG: hypothetical protein GF418_16005 [Chitinivibrionales bacterium]|nr:hypothetical protein [Chitinivibrionales bacterium]
MAARRMNRTQKSGVLQHLHDAPRDIRIVPQGQDAATGMMKWLVTDSYRKGKHWTHIQRSPVGADELALAIAEIREVTGKGSLTVPTFSELSTLYRRKHGDGGMGSCFDDMLADLEDSNYATNSISNYSSVVQRVMNWAIQRKKISMVPALEYRTKRTFRSRLYRGNERQRLQNAMDACDSHIYWWWRALETRPIRKGDISKLRIDRHLVLVGKNAPYIRWRPQKTGNRIQKETHIPLLDKRTGDPVDVDLFLYIVGSEECRRLPRPKDCPFMFPAVGSERNGLVSKLKPGEWREIGYPIKHWRYLCDEKHADIPDLHPHDLKHEAMRRMVLDEGWTPLEIRKLGINYSARAIEAYLNMDAMDALGAADAARRTQTLGQCDSV